MKKSFLVVLLTLFCLKVWGQEEVTTPPLITDRPSASESATLVPKGYLQLESGFTYQFDQDSLTKAQRISYNSSLFRYGINKNFELRLIVEYLKNKSIERKSDVATEVVGANSVVIGSKIFIREAKGLAPAMSLQCYLNLPYIGKKEFKPNHLAPSFRFSAVQSLSSKFSVTYNVGGSWDGNTPGATGLYTLNLGYNLLSNLGLYIEGYGLVPESGKSTHGFDGGVNYLIAKNFQIDAYGGIGLTSNSPDGFIAFGFSYRVGKK